MERAKEAQSTEPGMEDLIFSRSYDPCRLLCLNLFGIPNHIVMETLQQNSALGRTVQSLGYASIEDFAREQARSLIQQNMAYYQARIDLFEQKYGLAYSDFVEQFDSLGKYSIIEKEDDSMLWETAIDVVNAYRADLEAIAA